eukprot:m.64254 g.64254  ORF g.64254 m.64254 type:complete len:56 (-) comp12510_c1_seq2:85-252(-)
MKYTAHMNTTTTRGMRVALSFLPRNNNTASFTKPREGFGMLAHTMITVQQNLQGE